MKAVKEMEYFPLAEKLVNILMRKTQTNNPDFFRIIVAYYFAKVAATMRVNIKTPDRGDIPVSMYAINLASSGHGKGYATNIIEDLVIKHFKKDFLAHTFPKISQLNLAKLANARAIRDDIDPGEALEKVEKEFEKEGTLLFSFSSATTAAVKQMRHKLLMADAGAVNFEMDEFGSNLLGNLEVLSTFLELFDVGKVKQKLVKNTAENKRGEEIDGRTPTNMLLFGTPSKLLNGEKTEVELLAMLETGFARRCFFGYAKGEGKQTNLTPEEVYDMLTDTTSTTDLDSLATNMAQLANPVHFQTTLTMSKEVSILLITYKLKCEKAARELKDHEEIMKAEIAHRYYKVLKLAGAYAFVAGASKITEAYLYNAIKLAEDSGEALLQILTRERNYQKLAKYITDIGVEVTQVDLIEDLPFYRGSEAHKKELMTHAIAHGYKHNMVIKRSFTDGIEFIKGEKLKETNLDMLTISHSTAIATGYRPEYAPFSRLHELTTLSGMHYAAHHFKDGYRNGVSALPGFNLVILDVDSGVSLASAQMLLQEYTCLFSTTKRHTEENNRFRIVIPLSHTLKLGESDYSKFMVNVFNWLPFSVDEATKDIARKWETHPGQYKYQEGRLLDAMLFIPQTKKEEEYSQKVLNNQSMSNLERWFLLNTSDGNRSNQLIRYALALVDAGGSVESVRNAVLEFNNKLKDSLTEDEIHRTIMITVIKAITKREQDG